MSTAGYPIERSQRFFMYFPYKWGAFEEPQNPRNHRVVMDFVDLALCRNLVLLASVVCVLSSAVVFYRMKKKVIFDIQP